MIIPLLQWVVRTSTASSGGSVTSDGGSAIITEGVVYGTTMTPTTSGTKTSDGTATPFTSSLTGLTPNTLYYYRAYATNSVGTSYGTEMSFTTLVPAPPTITTFTPTSGNVGTTVTITGTNFNATAANNIVYFGAVRATVTAASTTSLTVTVPAGATYQPISLLDNTTGLTGYSSKPFITTFTNPFGTGIPANYYKPKVDFTTGTNSNPSSVAIGDVDGDGKPDMVVANFTSNTISVFRNISSSGTMNATSFATKIDFATGTRPSSVAIGDVDGDGKPDLVVSNQCGDPNCTLSGTISVFRNTSTYGSISASSFAANVEFSAGTIAKFVAIGDVDGDGKPEIMVVGVNPNKLSIFRNKSTSGSISAASFAAKVDFTAGSDPQSVAIGDVDGDGKPDMVMANYSSNTVSVFHNTSVSGSISASSFAAKVDFATGSSPLSVAIGDVDGDGNPDMVVANSGSNSVSVFRNTSASGSISATSFAAKVDFATGSYPLSVAIGDVDGDGNPDMVVANYGSNSVSVFRNTSASGSISAASFAAKVDFTTGANPRSVAIADVDGDGIPEIAGANYGSNSVSVLQVSAPASLTTDYFRTRQSGNWNTPATWESSPDNFATPSLIVSPATLSPDFNANTITIQNTHIVTITANVTTDQTTVNSGGSLIVNPNVILTLNDGTGTDLTVSSGGSMTIKSIATGTGSIGNSAGTVSGDVTVERYISSLTNRAYRLLGPSVNTTSSIHANWQEGAISRTNNPVSTYGTHITGTTVDQTNGFDATQTGQGSLFTYQQTPGAWIPATNTNTTLDAKMGYLLYIRGDRSINLDASSPFPSTNTTLRATGSLLTGAQTYLNLAGNDFSLVTNPYASAINWSSIYGNNTVTPGVYKFSNYYTYWDPNIGSRGGYVTVTNTGTVSPDPAITTPPNPNGTINIQSGQAFFVNSIIASPTLTIQESDKSTTNNIDVFRVTSAAQKFTASLYYTDAVLGRRLADGVTALYDNSYNAALDGNDAVEIGNFDENIAIGRNGKHLSIEERPIITATDTLPLFMNNMKQQGYEFEFNPGNLNPNMIAQLVDNYTGNKTFLNVTTTTVVPFTVTSNAASSATDRFYILFSPSGALPITLSSVKAFRQNLPNGQAGTGVKVEWTVQQELNMDRYEVEHSPNAQAFTKIASVNAANSNIISNYGIVDANPNAGDNFYRIKMIDKSAKISYSEIVKVNMANGGVNMITVSPNPVNGNTITLQLINLAKGSYTITVSNKLGQQILSKTIDHPGGSATQTIVLSKMFTTGVYQLKLSGAAITVTRQVIKN